MTDFAIKEQIQAIKTATERAVRSKESAIKFLIDAGIIDKKIEEKEKKEESKEK